MPLPQAVGCRTGVFAVTLAVAIGANATTIAQEAGRSSQVRSEDKSVASVIAMGIERSPTFKKLVAGVDATDGLVYVEHGECRNNVLACLHHSVVVSGPYRILRIVVSRRISRGCDLVSSIGHELQHALEALSDPRVRSTAEMFQFFQRIGPTVTGVFETPEAIRIGAQVGREACARR